MNFKKTCSIFLAICMTFSCYIMNVYAAQDLQTEVVQSDILGDADLGFEVSISDATAVQLSISGAITLSKHALELSDVNSDGYVNIKDVTEIQKYLAGYDNIYKIGQPKGSNDEPYTQPTTAVTVPATADTTNPTEATSQVNTTAPVEETTQAATTTPVETTQVATITPVETTQAITTNPSETTTPSETIDPDSWKENTGKIVLDSTITVTGQGATVVGNTVYITQGGDWEVTGSLDDGMIYINTGDEKQEYDKVKLRLNGMSLTNKQGPAIYFDRCKKAFITIEDGTNNFIGDTAVYSTANQEANGAIQSDDSLEIKGSGTLTVLGNYNHGISSSDDISIQNGTINITSLTDGIHANDNVTINEKTSNITINSTSDGIESEGTIDIALGNIKINSGGKGIKALLDLNITGGTIDITSTDDSIHSNANININSATITTFSQDDGIHADINLIIDGGTIEISKSYEGLEAQNITINDGNIKVAATDDGINAAGGNDGSSIGGRPGQNNFNPSSTSSAIIAINGGYVYVASSGDGIDSNGTIDVTGGTVIAIGPNSGGNSCLDSDTGLKYTGGTIIGISSSSAMWQEVTGGISGGTKVYNTNIGNVSSGKSIAITDSNSNVVVIITAPISGTLGVIYVSNNLSSTSSYKIVVGGTYSGALDNNKYGTGGTISGGTSVNATKN